MFLDVKISKFCNPKFPIDLSLIIAFFLLNIIKKHLYNSTCLPRSELGSLLNRSAAPHNLLLFINHIYILGGKLLIHFIKLLPVHSVFVLFCTYKNLHTCNSQASKKRRKWKTKILYFFIEACFITSIY